MISAGRLYPADTVTLREVGLRDGLQLVRRFPTTAAKKQWLQQEHAAGVRHFEVGSFLPASRMPQFADVHDLIAETARLGAYSSALALNERGAKDACDAQVDEIINVISATEEHSQANMRRSRADAIELVRRTRALSDASDHKPLVNAGIAMAFGCSIAGEVNTSEVLRLAEACLRAGAHAVGLADTVGFAGPAQVAALTRDLVTLCGDTPVLVHLHDTRGMAVANAAAAIDAGARALDGSLGGLGGCPFAPGATGNAVFEDLVYLCERTGIPTGIDLAALIGVRRILETEMPDEQLHGALARSGLPPRVKWTA
ncbi:hydroxymethylglutaryl-CoA lyase [Thalassovita sp.]|uniref:hydroxymethylglutaryl-CoA lyase n=1 Tax=Thalassovita sp. TaxID=1979401 RepID=UPI0029DE5F18|nr:hydroxymethylglutaryl-CoA lyase [Thalassovita sp.]